MKRSLSAARRARAAFLARTLLLLQASFLALGCTPPSSPKEVHTASPPRETPKARRLALQEYIPAPGLRWLVYLRPHDLLEMEDFRDEWSPLFGSERLRAFALASGITPHQVTEVWIAGYALGTLYVVDGSIVDGAAEESFRSRTLSQRNLGSPEESDIVHLSGMIQNTPQALVRIPHHMVAWADGDIGLARVVRAYAEGKLERTPSALQGVALAPYRDFEQGAPIRGYFVGPFPEASDVVVQSSASGAAAITVREGNLVVRAEARGLWPPLDDLGARLTTWADSVLKTPQMRILGWGSPVEPLAIRCSSPPPEESELRVCTGSGVWRSATIAEALYRLVAAPTDQMLGPPSPSEEESGVPAGSADTENRSP